MKKMMFLLMCMWATAAQAGIEVIDGDSLRIDGRRVRLEGIDAPEYAQTCQDTKGQSYSCGKNAKEALEQLVANGIKCECRKIDKYKREVSICFSGKVNVNRKMVADGWAIAYTRYYEDFAADEQYAKNNKLGIWRGKFMRPEIFRALEREKQKNLQKKKKSPQL